MTWITILLVFLIIFPRVINGKYANFSSAELKKLEIIREVKKYEKKINLDPTDNYLIFEEKSSRNNVLYFHDKFDLPFSFVDSKMEERLCPHDNIKENAKWLMEQEGIDLFKKDFYFYVTLGVAGGSKITRKFLKSSRGDIIEAVFHEDFHSNVNLPMNMEEAAADVIDTVAKCKFLSLDDFEISKRLLRRELFFALPIIRCREELIRLHDLYQKKVIDKKIYLLEKKRVLKAYKFKNITKLCSENTYAHYFPLMRALMISLHYDVGKFIKLMKECPFKDPQWNSNPGRYFNETRRREKQMEVWIRNIIRDRF